MLTKIEGMTHFKKLMDCSVPQLKKTPIEYLNDYNYYRDWFSNIILIKEKHNGKIIGYMDFEGAFYIKEDK